MARSARSFPLLAHADPRRRSHAVARLQAERALRSRYEDEYRQLEARLGAMRAVTNLVRRHAKEYGRLVSQAPGIDPSLAAERAVSA